MLVVAAVKVFGFAVLVGWLGEWVERREARRIEREYRRYGHPALRGWR
jgi:citrate synthase